MKTTPQRKPYEWLIHAAAWGIFFLLPLFFTGQNGVETTWSSYIRFALVPISFMVIFYINYNYLIDRFLFAKRPVTFMVINFVLIALLVFSVHLIMVQLHSLTETVGALPRNHPPRPPRNIDFVFFGNAFFYLLSAGLSVAIKMTNQWYKEQTERKEIERSRAEAELKNLKSQLNPHFLFNTLNNIYALIAVSPDRAQRAVHDLSRLLRYVLYENNAPYVPLHQELDFVRNYIELMRIRLPEQVRITTDIGCEDPNTPIAPLLFISLIENAFKHGVSDQHPSFIEIAITQQAGSIRCLLKNSCFPKSDQDKSGSGIGLQNLQKRLSLLYPDRALFTYGCKGEVYCTLLEIKTAVS